MKYIYLLLLILVLYYLFKNIYNKYSNQENFDPSLVPVSSIVTLAKVAQKLVDGGGTLTNPGNLQIGLPSAGAVGNLYVTGTNKVDGVSTFNNPVTINGKTTFTGDQTINGNQTINGKSTVSDVLNANGNMIISNSNPYITFLKSGTAPANAPQLYSDGSTIHAYNGDFQADKAFTVSGTTTLNGSTRLKSGVWHTDSEGNKRLHFGLNSNSFYESANGWHNFRNSSDVDAMTLDPSGNLNVAGVIISGHTYVKCFTVNSGPKDTNKYIYDGAPLKEGITYLVEAHLSYLHTGSGFDGIRAYFDNAIGPEWQMSYISGHANNILDLGGSAQSGVGATAQRSSAVAVIYGPNIKLAIQTGTDDSYNLTVCLIAKPCNTFK